ncbi:MAG: M48 family metalloprotease [Streptosporangiaceae bacterium]
MGSTESVSADVVRRLVARQRARLRVLAVVAVGALLLIAGVVALAVAGATLSVAGTIAVPCLILVVVVIAVAVTRHPERRAVFLDDADAREYLDRVEPIVARVAGALHVASPTVRIIDDEAANALSIGSDRDGSVAYTSGLLDEVSDERQLEAVTAHLVARMACGDNNLVLFSFALLGWVLEFLGLPRVQLTPCL